MNRLELRFLRISMLGQAFIYSVRCRMENDWLAGLAALVLIFGWGFATKMDRKERG